MKSDWYERSRYTGQKMVFSDQEDSVCWKNRI